MTDSKARSNSTPCAACGGRAHYLVSPWRTLGHGANGLFAQVVQTCAHVQERGFFGRVAEQDVLRAAMSLRVCAGCGASQLYTDPAGVKAMLDAGHAGVELVHGD
jgi:hypothetical protein